MLWPIIKYDADFVQIDDKLVICCLSLASYILAHSDVSAILHYSSLTIRTLHGYQLFYKYQTYSLIFMPY